MLTSHLVDEFDIDLRMHANIASLAPVEAAKKRETEHGGTCGPACPTIGGNRTCQSCPQQTCDCPVKK